MTTIEREIEALKERVTQLEARITHQEKHYPPSTIPPLGKDADRDQLRVWLEAKGVIANLPAEAQTMAENWRKLRETEKQEHTRSMRDLKLDPPLSQIIVENRQ